jgi:cell division protease FtsH
MVMSEKEKELTAYHEAGHALLALWEEGNDPLHKVTIIPRGRALGLTMSLPERDKYSQSKKEMEARLVMAFGGRVAEQIIFGEENVTTGASGDISMATSMARRMVTEYGMSEKLGRVRYSANEQEVFLGHSVTQTQNMSEVTANTIDSEVRRIIETAEAKARVLLTKGIDDLHKLAKALLEFETLSGDDVKALLRGEPIVRPTADDPPPTTKPGGRRGSVPSSGTKPAGGFDPQPQPGA